jgi:putative oxidoreductase
MNALLRLAALQPLAQLALRVALAVPFLRSGLTKWDGVGRLSDSAVYLFTEEFRLHILGRELPLPMPSTLALVAACAEILLPVLLLAGLATRAAAIGLLAMTAVIQLTVPDGWANFHLSWAAMALAIAGFGAGPLALDHWVARRR